MFRAHVWTPLVWTLRQRRYAALAVAALIVALICVGLGTFEIHRYHEKQHDNSALRNNAHAAGTRLTTSLVPLTGHGPAPDTNAIRFRHVSVQGRYVAGHQQYVANQIQGGRQGFCVLTPFDDGTATLLVVRGFVAATPDETRPAIVPQPPSGEVRLTGWLDAAQTGSDKFGQLGHGEIVSINPGEQSARLGTPVYQASLTLTAHQPGTAGLGLVPQPGLGNPSGGAEEWQLLSYVIQWYALAALALAMPFLVSRSEAREARRRFLGIDPGAVQLDAVAGVPETGDALIAAGASGRELVARRRGELAQRASDAQRIERATRLADRYGLSLGIDPEQALAGASRDGSQVGSRPVVRDSATGVHRSADEYHASYNDYLWQLALADGGLPATSDKAEPKRIEAVPGPDDAEPGDEAPIP